MPAKPDFQVLVDFCEQPAPNPYQRRVVAAALSLSKEDQRDTHYTGFLDYYPPHLSKWWPEHFQGIADRTLQSKHRLDCSSGRRPLREILRPDLERWASKRQIRLGGTRR